MKNLSAIVLLLFTNVFFPFKAKAQTINSVSTFAGSGSAALTNGTGTAAAFRAPNGVAIDASGNLYVADQDNHCIRKITPTGVVTTFAGTGSAGFSNGTGTSASFRNPAGVAVDASGNVYVADYFNFSIRKITAAGVVTTFAGSGSSGFANGTGTSATFRNPNGIAVDASGNVYVADYTDHRIRKITSAGVVTTFAGSGTSGNVNANGTSASFNNPSGVAVDGSGNVYVLDRGGNRIRKITSAGEVSNLAGSGSAGFTDATGESAQFNSPNGLTVDGAGNIYVADMNNHRIRKVTSVGVVTTIAGSGSSAFADGIGAAASFSRPQGIVIDGNGILMVGDANNNRIRKIPTCATPSTPTISGNATFCDGSSTTLTSSSATGNLWSNGATTQSIIVTTVGTYSVRVISGVCTSASSANFNTTVSSQDPSIYVNGSSTICSGQTVSLSSFTSQGTLCSFANERSNLTITAPTGGKFVRINFASYGLPNGTCGNYTIGSCHATNSKTVVEGYLLGNSTGTIPAENAVFGDPCIGTVKNLAVEAVYLVNQAGSSYLWSNGATTANINVNPSTTTTYRCRVTVGSCVYLDSVTITVNPIPTTPTISGTLSFCAGGSTTLTSSSATGNLWSTGATTQSITVNTVGSYSVSVISNACSSAISNAVSVTSNAIPTTPTISGATSFCSGGNTTISTTRTLFANERYLWSDNSTSSSLSVTAAGTYSLRIRNNITGCTSAASNAIVVTVNALPTTPTISGTTTICAGNSTILTASNASGYLWSTGATTRTISVSTAGSYTVRTIESGCTSAASTATTISVTALPSTPSISGSTSFCAGGSTTLTSSAGSAYLWNTGATTQSITVNTAGSYSVRTISSGCTSATSSTINVTQGSLDPSIYVSGQSTICSGQSVSLSSAVVGTVCNQALEGDNLIISTPAGGRFVSVDFASYGLPNGTCGNYTIGSCHATNSKSIVEGYLLGNSTGTIPATNGVFGDPCNGTFKNLAVQATYLASEAGSTYLWSNGATTANINVSPTTTTTYRCTVTIGGCVYIDSVVITVNPTPATPTISGATAICAGSNTTLTTTRTLNTNEAYLWSDNSISNSLSVSAAGTYSLRIRNTVTGCTSAASNSVTLTVNTIPTTPTISGATSFCAGGNTTLSTTRTLLANERYLWSDNSSASTLLVSAAGTYSLRIRNNITGCTSAASNAIVVTVNAIPTTATISGATTVCTGNTTTLITARTLGGNEAYLWSNNSNNATLQVSTAGTYSLRIRNTSTGCTSAISNTITVAVISNTAPTITGTTSFCTGGNTVLTASASAAYLWSTGATTQSITVSSASSYTVRSITSGCTSLTSATTTVTVNALPNTRSITPTTPAATCGTAVTLTASTSTGNTYQWKLNGTDIPGATAVTYNAPTSGNYTVVAVTPAGCSSATLSNVVAVTVNALPTTPTISGSTAICSGSSTTLTTTRTLGTNEAYLWSTGATTQNITVSAAGTYSLSIRNSATSCTSAASNTISVTVSNMPATPTISGSSTFCAGSSTLLTSSSSTGNLWSTGETAQSILVNTAGNYSVRVINGACTSATSTNFGLTSIASGTWLGLTTDWNNAANWCGGVPTSSTNITFPNTGTLPAITGSGAICNNLTIPAGITLNIANGGTFNLKGNLSGLGEISGVSGSTLALTGSSTQTIQRVNIGNLTVNNSAGVVLSGNVRVSNGITLSNGILNTRAYNLILTSTANAPTETSSSYIIGNVRNNARLVNTGAVSMLGISIAAGTDNLDTVMIERSETIATFNGNEGIGHIWKIRAGNQPTSGRQITLSWNARADNGKTLGRMQVYRRPDNGTEWIKVGALTDGSTRSITVTTNSFSDWTVSGEDAPLPVTWLSFTGTQTQFGNQLKWTTGSEVNNQGFAIERSTDGRNFTKIGFVKGIGTTNAKQNYQFTDNQLSEGYYRLQQLDFDGKTEYSATIKVGENELGKALEVYPNPATDKVTVKTSGIGTLEIVNLVGQVVISQPANETNEINISKLAKGVYTVRFNEVSQKLVVR